jgi:hypothetical protein
MLIFQGGFAERTPPPFRCAMDRFEGSLRNTSMRFTSIESQIAALHGDVCAPQRGISRGIKGRLERRLDLVEDD